LRAKEGQQNQWSANNYGCKYTTMVFLLKRVSLRQFTAYFAGEGAGSDGGLGTCFVRPDLQALLPQLRYRAIPIDNTTASPGSTTTYIPFRSPLPMPRRSSRRPCDTSHRRRSERGSSMKEGRHATTESSCRILWARSRMQENR